MYVQYIFQLKALQIFDHLCICIFLFHKTYIKQANRVVTMQAITLYFAQFLDK